MSEDSQRHEAYNNWYEVFFAGYGFHERIRKLKVVVVHSDVPTVVFVVVIDSPRDFDVRTYSG